MLLLDGEFDSPPSPVRKLKGASFTLPALFISGNLFGADVDKLKSGLPFLLL